MVCRGLILIFAFIIAGCSSSAPELPASAAQPTTFVRATNSTVGGWTQFNLPTTIVVTLALGHDGNLYSFGYDSQRQSYSDIARIDTSGNETLLPMTGKADGSGQPEITPNPDGNVYAIEDFSDGTPAVAKVTPAGAITEFRLATSDVATGIVTGSDRNLWIVLSNGVGRLTRSGQFTEFAGGPYEGGVQAGLAVGPDKNVWFNTYNNSNQNLIVRVTTSGSQTAFPLPSDATRLTRGTDGNLYCVGKGQIYGIGMDGTVTTYRAGHAMFGVAMAAGHGQLWWSDKNSAFGWNVKHHRGETDVAAPLGGSDVLSFGADGNLWLTQGPLSNTMYILHFI